MARRQRVMMEAPIGPPDLPHEREEPDAPDDRQHAERQQAQPKDCAAPIGHFRQHDIRQRSEIPDETHARRAEAQHARSQHRAKREQQGREQAEEQVGPAEPQPRQHGRTARRAARQRLKLRGQLLRRPQLRGDLFLRIPVRQLEREVLFVFFHHIGGIRHISPA